MKHFLSFEDVPDIEKLLDLAIKYKSSPLRDKHIGQGKRIGLLFLNPSLRTRLSTQVAAANLGMEAVVFNVDKEGWALEFEEGAVMSGNTVEHIKDAAPVLGKYFDVLAIRTFPGLLHQEEDYSEMYIQQFIKFAGVPVLSLESATLHPLQSFADVITIEEQLTKHTFKRKPKVVLTWAPHIKPLPHCVANSFAQWMTGWGKVDLIITHPKGYELSESFTKGATIEYNQEQALRDADFVYVKNWSTFQPYGKLLEAGSEWMLTGDNWKLTNQAKIMHCLPVRRNVELSDEMLDSPFSLVTEQAANRVWSAQAVIAEMLKEFNK